MIKNQDRSRWFGASDTNKIMGNWKILTFSRWWAEKIGITTSHFSTLEMRAGTAYEHRILDFIGIRKRDRQIKDYRLRLRVNLDGENAETVYEVKTHKSQPFRLSSAYWQQCQVEMFVTGKSCEIVAYRLLPEDYENFFREIDPERITRHPIEYDPGWIEREYLPRLEYLARCLRRKETPDAFRF